MTGGCVSDFVRGGGGKVGGGVAGDLAIGECGWGLG